MTHVSTARSYSLARKLTRMNLLVSGTALLTACAAFVAYDLATFRETLVRNLSVEAEIIGANSVAALEFDDAGYSGENIVGIERLAEHRVSRNLRAERPAVRSVFTRWRGSAAARSARK